MFKTLLAATALSLVSTAVMAETVGVSMALFDDNFLTVLRNGMVDDAKNMKNVDVVVENAQNSVAKQLDQINNFIANGVDAIIVNPVDTSATQAMTNAAKAAGVPLVYVNRMPVNIDSLPKNEAFVASDERQSGTLETIQVCKDLAAKGLKSANVYVIMGQLSNQAAVQRTKDITNVMKSGKCAVKLHIIDKQTANWSRDKAQDLMTNWLSTGKQFDGVISNNDEMAIGAIQAMSAAGVDPKSKIIGGIDATQDGLQEMKKGNLNVTVFQNAAGQGAGALKAALELAKGQKVPQKVFVPFELVTPKNVDKYLKKNK